MTASASGPAAARQWIRRCGGYCSTRKIVLLITDGEPDDQNHTLAAIRLIKSFGLEVYGIGIKTLSIQTLLPGRGSKVINDIMELAPSMFEILQSALIGERRTS